MSTISHATQATPIQVDFQAPETRKCQKPLDILPHNPRDCRTDIDVLVGGIVRRRRKSLKLCQKDISTHLKCSITYVSRLEHGACKMSPDQQRRLLAAVDWSREDMFHSMGPSIDMYGQMLRANTHQHSPVEMNQAFPSDMAPHDPDQLTPEEKARFAYTILPIDPRVCREELSIIFGRTIKKRRESMNMSRKDLSLRLGCTETNVMRLEGGKAARGLGRLSDIFAAFDWNSEEMVALADEPVRLFNRCRLADSDTNCGRRHLK